MANTNALKNKVEEYFRKNFLPGFLNSRKNELMLDKIEKRKCNLMWGGEFEFDAVVYSKPVKYFKLEKNILEKSINEDGKNKTQQVYCLSTASYKTASGNPGSGKLLKLKADILMLSGCNCPEKFLALTDIEMFNKIIEDQKNGRLPKSINVIGVELPQDLTDEINEIKQKASDEVTKNSKNLTK